MSVDAKMRGTDISDPKALKQWLVASGRKYIVFNAVDLVDGIDWPTGVNNLIDIVARYRTQRRMHVLDTAECPKCKKGQTSEGLCGFCRGAGRIVTRTKEEVLEIDELEEVIAYCNEQIADLKAAAAKP